MQGSLGHIIWTVCYLSVLIGLSAYGVHRYFIIYLFLKSIAQLHPGSLRKIGSSPINLVAVSGKANVHSGFA